VINASLGIQLVVVNVMSKMEGTLISVALLMKL